jgi:hypothetical protein
LCLGNCQGIAFVGAEELGAGDQPLLWGRVLLAQGGVRLSSSLYDTTRKNGTNRPAELPHG